jgi:hypothetical protein
MEQQGASVHKTFTYQLLPTSEQEQALATVVWRSRELYNAGLQERKPAWEMCGVCVSFAMQSAQLPAIKEVRPEYCEIDAQVLQDVLHRLDRAFAACFRRVTTGAHPGYPRLQGKGRYHSFTYPQVGEHGGHGGAALDGMMLSLSKIGRIRMRLHRPCTARPRQSPSAEKQMGGMPASGVLRCPACYYLLLAERQASMWGSRSFSSLPMGRWSPIRATTERRNSSSPERNGG